MSSSTNSIIGHFHDKSRLKSPETFGIPSDGKYHLLSSGFDYLALSLNDNNRKLSGRLLAKNIKIRIVRVV